MSDELADALADYSKLPKRDPRTTRLLATPG